MSIIGFHLMKIAGVIVIALMISSINHASEIPPEHSQPKENAQHGKYTQLANKELATTIFNHPDPPVPRRFKGSEDDILRHRQMFYDLLLQSFCPDFVFKRLQDKDEIDARVLKSLQWSVKTDANSYRTGQLVGFDVALKNVSEEDAFILLNVVPRWFTLHSIKLRRVSGDTTHEVYLTKTGYNTYLDYVSWPVYALYNSSPEAKLLEPGEEGSIVHDISPLNKYYDLSVPGEYELTFYTRNYIGDNQIGEYPKPCTIRFTIEDKKNWLDDHVEWPAEDESPVNPDAPESPSG